MVALTWIRLKMSNQINLLTKFTKSIMKKTFRFASAAALGMLVFASCSTDDLGFAGQDIKQHNGRQLIIEVDEPVSDEPVTRSLMRPDKNTAIWEEGDVIRGYDELLHVYDNYAYDESAERFYVDGDPDLSYEKTKYTFFGDASYGGWKKGVGLTALTKIDEVFEYSEKDVETKEYAAKAYAGNLPMFGKIEELKEGDDAGALRSRLVFLTGALKVTLQNGSKTVKAIKVSSLTEDGEPNLEMPLSGYFDAVLDSEDETFSRDVNTSHLQKSEEDVLQKNYSHEITVSTENLPEFTSIVYVPIIPSAKNVTDATTYPKLKVVWVDAEGKENEITTFEKKLIQAHHFYTNGQDGNKMEVSVKIQVQASSFARLQQIINEYAAKGLAVDIENTLKVTATSDDYELTIPANAPAMKVNLAEGLVNESGTDIVIKGGKGAGEFTLNASSYDNKSKWIDLSDYEGDFNVEGFNAKAVKGQKKEGTFLTIGSLSNVQVNGGNIVVKGSVARNLWNYGAGSVEVTETATVENLINGKEGGKEGEDKSGDIIVAGVVKTLNNNIMYDDKTKATITVDGGYVGELVNNGGNINFDGGSFGTLHNTNKGGKIVLKDMDGTNVTGKNNSSELTDDTGKNLEIYGKEGQTSYNIWTINKNGGNTVKIKDMQVNSLNIKPKSATVFNVEAHNLKLGYVQDSGDLYAGAGLVYHAAVKDAPLNFKSTGKTWIEAVKVKNVGDAAEQTYAQNMAAHRNTTTPAALLVNFTSEWDGESKAEKAVGTSYDVYTAAELASLLDYNKQTGTQYTVNLYANIDLKGGNNVVWTGINAFEKATTLNGNGRTIENVTIGNTETSKDHRGGQQPHYGFGFINVAKADLTVNDLTLNNVNTDGLKLWNEIKSGLAATEFMNQISAVGGLVGWQKGNGTYKNVTVNATTLGLEESGNRPFGNTYSTDNVKVGGLVGMTANVAGMQTNIEKCTVAVSGKIIGQWALGGLIGCVDVKENDMTNSVVLKNNNVSVEKFVPTLHIEGKEPADELSDYYGTIGMLIGCITDADRGNIKTALTITQEAGYTINDCIVGKRADLGFIKNARTVANEYEVFNGYEIKGSVYVGYSWSNNTGEVTLNINGWTKPTKTPTVNDLNVFVAKKRSDTANYARKH